MKNQRKSRGLSLRDVGEIIGVHHSIIGKMETDRRIDIVEYVEYCRLMNIDPNEGLSILLDSMNKDSTHTSGK